MTEQEKFLEIVARAWMIGFDDAIERLKRGEGSGALTGFAAAKRAAEPGGAEEEGAKRPEPQSLAVSPVEAEANKLRRLVNHWRAMVLEMQDDAATANCMGYPFKSARLIAMAEAVKMCAADVLARLPKPESESSENAGDGKLPTDSIEAGNDSNNGTASGRRNDKDLARRALDSE